MNLSVRLVQAFPFRQRTWLEENVMKEEIKNVRIQRLLIDEQAVTSSSQ